METLAKIKAQVHKLDEVFIEDIDEVIAYIKRLELYKEHYNLSEEYDAADISEKFMLDARLTALEKKIEEGK